MTKPYSRGKKSLIYLSQSEEYAFTKSKQEAIFRALTYSVEVYTPTKTVSYVDDLIDDGRYMGRLLYSEASNFIFNLEEPDRDTFSTNIEHVLRYALKEENKVGDDTKAFLIKLYDHSQLALIQTDTMNDVFEKNLVDMKDNVSEETKRLEREYITILGVFAAIVLTFVGGMTFSSSVVENMHLIPPFRLLFVIAALGMVLINIFYLLCKFITEINKITFRFPIVITNIVLAVIAMGGFVCMLFNTGA